MAEFQVSGLDRETGEHRSTLIEARTRDEAIERASAAGIVVETADRTGGRVPIYGGLRAVARVLVGAGFVGYGLAVLGVVVGLAVLIVVKPNEAAESIPFIVSAFGVLVVALLLHGTGEGLAALRDIARNSFR